MQYDALNRATNAICLPINLQGFATMKYQIAYDFDAVGKATNRTDPRSARLYRQY
ncbi:MAG: hypothetical protein WCS94_12195 [Verrucomicrobiota bacterium]